MRLSNTVLVLAVLTASQVVIAQGARRDEPASTPASKQPVMTAPPEVVEAAPPVYPKAAAEAGLEAIVKVRIHIDATGAVTKVDVLEAVGNGFDEAAVAAATLYRFKPAEFDGVPGPLVVETAINFVIEKPEIHPEPNWPATPKVTIDPEAIGPPQHGGDIRTPVSIEGVALERGNRRKLAGVIVSVSELGLDLVTDASGRFYFHDLPPGTYNIIADVEGFDRFARKLEVADKEKVEIKIYLRPSGGNPYQTFVEGEREILEVTRRTITRRQMTSVPGTFGDPIRVIQTLPGLARTPFGTGFLVIRGSNPDDSGVFIDGHRVPLLFHFLGGPSVMNSEFLETIELFPGGFPARYGRSIGGIVSVGTRPSKSDGYHGSADIDVLDSSAYIRAPLGENGSVAVAGRRSYLNLLLPFFVPEPEEGNLLIVVPVYFDYQARLDYDLKKHGKGSLFAIGSGDRLDVLSEDAEDEEFFNLNTSIDFFRIIATYKRKITDDIDLTISPAWGRDRFSFAGSQTEGSAVETGLELTQTVFSYRVSAKGRLHEDIVIDVGADLESRNVRYDITAIDDTGLAQDEDDTNLESERFIRNYDALLYGVHADVALDLGKLRLIPGIRFDGAVLSGRSKFSVDPRLVGRYAIDPKVTVKGYLGLFSQPPQPEAFDNVFGNPKLGLEAAVHSGIGSEWKPSEDWTLDGEVYYISRFNQVAFTGEVEFDPETGQSRAINFRNSAAGNTVGLEVLIRREVTRRLYGWLSYTLSRSVLRRNVDNPNSSTIFSTFDQRHNLNAVASYKVGRGWELGARLRLTTGRPDTPITGGTFDANDGGYNPNRGEARSTRRPLFHQLDIRAEKTWLFNTWSISGYLDVQNLYNAENPEAIQNDYRFRETAPVRGVPILPTLGVKGSF